MTTNTATPGDSIEVSTDDRTYEGTVVQVDEAYKSSDTADRPAFGSADVTHFERADGHRMYAYDYGDVTDLYTHRGNTQASNGNRSIVAKDVDVTVDAGNTDDLTPVDDVDFDTFEAGDRVTLRLANGTEETHTVDAVDTPHDGVTNIQLADDDRTLGDYDGNVSIGNADDGFDAVVAVGVDANDDTGADDSITATVEEGSLVYHPIKALGTVVDPDGRGGTVGVRFDKRMGETVTYVDADDLFVKVD